MTRVHCKPKLLRYLSSFHIAIEHRLLPVGAKRIGVRFRVKLNAVRSQPRETLDLWITGYEDQVGVASCPEWAPPEFGPRPGAPCGLVERQSRARDGSIAEVSRNWFDSNVARYVARMR